MHEPFGSFVQVDEHQETPSMACAEESPRSHETDEDEVTEVEGTVYCRDKDKSIEVPVTKKRDDDEDVD